MRSPGRQGGIGGSGFGGGWFGGARVEAPSRWDQGGLVGERERERSCLAGSRTCPR